MLPATKENLGENLAGEGIDDFLMNHDPFSLVKEITSSTPRSSTSKNDLEEGHHRSFHYFHNNLKAYLHACINSNRVAKAHETFIWLRYSMMKRSNEAKLDVSTYNIVLHGWALSARLDKVKELFRMMRLAKVKPNTHSYALYFLCLAKRSNFDTKLIKNLVVEMEKQQLPLDRLFIDSNLFHDEVQLVSQLIKSQFPDISFVQSPVEENYECDLLKNFNETHKLFQPLDVPVSQLKEGFAKQLEYEKRSFVHLKSIYVDKNIPAHQMHYYIKVWGKLENEWRKVLRKVLNEKIKQASLTFFRHNGFNIYPFIAALDTNTMTEIVLDEVRNLISIFSEYYSPPFVHMCSLLGNRVQNVYLTKIRQKQATFDAVEKVYSCYLDDLTGERKFNSRVFMEKEARKLDVNFNSNINEMRWSRVICAQVGKFLYDIILDHLVVNSKILYPKTNKENSQHILQSFYQTQATKITKVVRPNKRFLNLCRSLRARNIIFDCNALPMACPPMPWLSPRIGAYFLTDSEFVREIRGASVVHTVDTCPAPVLDALNALQLQPWKINQPILDLMIKVFNTNGDSNLDIPLHQSAMPEVPQIPQHFSSSERAVLVKERIKVTKERNEMYSLWCDCLYKLSIANHFKNSVIWLPHNLDFRGRVYTIPPHLQHLGSDVSRGLLLFANGKPLGPSGLDWLKIHLVNLTGALKHSSNEERLQFANENLDKIINSAREPMSEEGSWWKKSEEPWQTLACCMEIANAIDSGDAESFVSHFPVHQDGSCNGLQHYAALGRDQVGAESVNLQKFDRPQDVYNEVAKLVEEKRVKDAADGHKMASSLDGIVSRKVVKQPVMTFVYGVTPYGAKKQVMKRLNELPDFGQNELRVSDYIVKNVFYSLEHMFTATREIQSWFNACADVISKQLGQPVKWTTPLGFQVVQPYVKFLVKEEEKQMSFEWKINSMKQKNGFAPNFIHSLDSVHMMLTALHCEASGVNFVAVHDCFWTHPRDVQAIGPICREQFVAMHSLPILSKLSDSFIQTYSKELTCLAAKSPEEFNSAIETLIAVPATGSFDLKQVLHSTYFFS